MKKGIIMGGKQYNWKEVKFISNEEMKKSKASIIYSWVGKIKIITKK